MPAPDFHALERRLLKRGILPAHARRAVRELEEHYDDLVDEALATGASENAAMSAATDSLGDFGDFQAAMAAQDSLRGWAWRWPRVAQFIYPVAFALALPAVPFYAGIRNAPVIGRWLTCLFMGGFVTAAMFLFLELVIMTGGRY
jgi:hypothetical protein